MRRQVIHMEPTSKSPNNAENPSDEQNPTTPSKGLSENTPRKPSKIIDVTSQYLGKGLIFIPAQPKKEDGKKG
jgi:hypothetical protein